MPANHRIAKSISTQRRYYENGLGKLGQYQRISLKNDGKKSIRANNMGLIMH